MRHVCGMKTKPKTGKNEWTRYRTEYPRIRGRYIKGNEYFIVDLRRAGHVGGVKTKTFTDLAEAKTHAAEVASKVRHGGLSSLVDSRLARWQEQANIHDLNLDQVVELGFKTAIDQKAKEVSPVLNGLIDLWIASKEKNTKLASDTLRGYRNSGKKFKDDFGDKKIGEIDHKFCRDYLTGDQINGGDVYRNNLRRSLYNFFKWAIEENHATKNPVEKIKIDTRDLTAPAYYDVEQCKTIMREAMKTPEIVPYFALCLFLGVRPKECERLEWYGDHGFLGKWGVKLDSNYAILPGGKTKTKRPRQIELNLLGTLPENSNLIAWLKAYKVEGKPLRPKNFTRAKAAVHKAIKGFKIDGSGMRHTYATFAYAVHHNLQELRHIMGNSPKVIDKFYRGLIGDNDVKAFWNITPESLKAP